MAEYSVRYSTYGAYSLIIIGLFLNGLMNIFCRKIYIGSTIFFVCFFSFLFLDLLLRCIFDNKPTRAM